MRALGARLMRWADRLVPRLRLPARLPQLRRA